MSFDEESTLITDDPRIGKLAREKGSLDMPRPIEWIMRYADGHEDWRIAAGGIGTEGLGEMFEIVDQDPMDNSNGI